MREKRAQTWKLMGPHYTTIHDEETTWTVQYAIIPSKILKEGKYYCRDRFA